METTTEMPLYNLVKDGNGMEHKIANVLHPDNVQQSGTIELTCIRKSNRHEPNYSFAVVEDPTSGIIYGEVEGIDQITKQLIFRRITLVQEQTLNLSSVQDRRIWMVAQRHKAVEGCPYPSNQKPMFRIKDRQRDAKMKMIKVKTRQKAIEIINEMKHGELVDMCYNMGISSVYDDEEILKAELMEVVETKATSFCELYDNAKRKIITVLNRARAVGLVSLDPTNGLMWENAVPLGHTEAAAVNYLEKNIALLQAMDFKSKELSPNYKTFATEEEKKTSYTKIAESPEKDLGTEPATSVDVNRTLLRLQEKEKELDALIKKVKAASPEEPAKESNEEKVKAFMDSKTLEQCQKKAEELGYVDAWKENKKEKLVKYILANIKK